MQAIVSIIERERERKRKRERKKEREREREREREGPSNAFAEHSKAIQKISSDSDKEAQVLEQTIHPKAPAPIVSKERLTQKQKSLNHFGYFLRY